MTEGKARRNYTNSWPGKFLVRCFSGSMFSPFLAHWVRLTSRPMISRRREELIGAVREAPGNGNPSEEDEPEHSSSRPPISASAERMAVQEVLH